MYVVRLTHLDGGMDFKAFVARPDAVKRFKGGTSMAWNDRLEYATLFDVPGVSDVREAVEAVKAGKAVLLDTDGIAELDKGVADLVDEWIKERTPPSSDVKE